MPALEPWMLGVVELRDAVARGEIAPREAVESCLARIDAYEAAVGAWEHLDSERALAEADTVAAGALRGVPSGVKDIFNTRDMPTTMGSPAWAEFTPGNDARVVHYARHAGSIVLGKTVTAEFAVHTPGKTRNPHELTRSPGTSSSGSAAAVACGMVPWALASQTAGSIVRPASYVGVYGFKPSYGSIPRTGMLKTTDTLDQVGFFARSARDLAPVFDTLRVHGSDYPLVHETLDRYEPIDYSRRPPRVGLVTDALDVWGSTLQEARAALLEYAEVLAGAGVHVEEACPPAVNEAHSVHDIIYDRSIAYYFDGEARAGKLVSDVILAMWERGQAITLEQYRDALARQTRIQREVSAFASGYDVLLTLSTAGPAPSFGEPDLPDSALVWTLVGLPVVSAPAFRTADGLPFGAQFVAGRFRDLALLDLLAWLDDRRVMPAVEPVTPQVSAAAPIGVVSPAAGETGRGNS
jgi:Asp-tRNA(Asn)/Glu-tRNA(Gln) amidotransferase A subunit family amidase